jgi:hypothetical protein
MGTVLFSHDLVFRIVRINEEKIEPSPFLFTLLLQPGLIDNYNRMEIYWDAAATLTELYNKMYTQQPENLKIRTNKKTENKERT